MYIIVYQDSNRNLFPVLDYSAEVDMPQPPLKFGKAYYEAYGKELKAMKIRMQRWPIKQFDSYDKADLFAKTELISEYWVMTFAPKKL